MKTTLFSSSVGDINASLAFINNLAATTIPGVTDDSGDGYSVGSVWVNTAASTAYICTDNTAGAAAWSLMGDSDIDPTELGYLNGASPNTVVNSKAAIYSTTGGVARSSATVTALSSNQAGAAALTAELNAVTAADDTKGVKLPTAAANMIVQIINTVRTRSLKIYPATGAQINALGANVAYVLKSGQLATFIARSTTLWEVGINPLGEATTDTVAFYGVTPIAQRASASQNSFTPATYTSVATATFSAVGTGSVSGIWGFASSTVAKSIPTQLNKIITDSSKQNTLLLEIRAGLVALGAIKGTS